MKVARRPTGQRLRPPFYKLKAVNYNVNYTILLATEIKLAIPVGEPVLTLLVRTTGRALCVYAPHKTALSHTTRNTDCRTRRRCHQQHRTSTTTSNYFADRNR